MILPTCRRHRRFRRILFLALHILSLALSDSYVLLPIYLLLSVKYSTDTHTRTQLLLLAVNEWILKMMTIDTLTRFNLWPSLCCRRHYSFFTLWFAVPKREEERQRYGAWLCWPVPRVTKEVIGNSQRNYYYISFWSQHSGRIINE